MQGRFIINLDFLLFSLLNLIFFLSYYLLLANPPTCSELPTSTQILQYMHLILFVLYFMAFIMRTWAIILYNQDSFLTKSMKCLINMGLFLGTLAFLIVFLRLFYLFNRTTEACGGLDSLLIVDFGVTGTSLPGVLLYRLCFRSLLGVERIEEDGFGIKGKELYGTMDKEEEEQQNLEE